MKEKIKELDEMLNALIAKSQEYKLLDFELTLQLAGITLERERVTALRKEYEELNREEVTNGN